MWKQSLWLVVACAALVLAPASAEAAIIVTVPEPSGALLVLCSVALAWVSRRYLV